MIVQRVIHYCIPEKIGANSIREAYWARHLVAAVLVVLLGTLASDGWAQQVSPALLKAAQESYRRQLTLDSPALASRPQRARVDPGGKPQAPAARARCLSARGSRGTGAPSK